MLLELYGMLRPTIPNIRHQSLPPVRWLAVYFHQLRGSSHCSHDPVMFQDLWLRKIPRLYVYILPAIAHCGR